MEYSLGEVEPIGFDDYSFPEKQGLKLKGLKSELTLVAGNGDIKHLLALALKGVRCTIVFEKLNAEEKGK